MPCSRRRVNNFPPKRLRRSPGLARVLSVPGAPPAARQSRFRGGRWPGHAENAGHTAVDNNKTYADVDPQVRAVLGRDELTAHDHERATEPVVGLILRGCGLG